MHSRQFAFILAIGMVSLAGCKSDKSKTQSVEPQNETAAEPDNQMFDDQDKPPTPNAAEPDKPVAPAPEEPESPDEDSDDLQ